MNNRSDAAPRRGRPYVARLCGCGEKASYVVQVVARTLGPRSRANRQTTMGKATVLCGVCVRNVHTYTDQLSDSACDAVRPLFQAQGGPGWVR